VDQFFLCIEAGDTNFDAEKTRQFLLACHAKDVVEVPA
jgi:hypothetical protein